MTKKNKGKPNQGCNSTRSIFSVRVVDITIGICTLDLTVASKNSKRDGRAGLSTLSR